MGLPKYSYSLFLLLSAFFIYSPDISYETVALLIFFVVIAVLAWVVEYLGQYAWFKSWLNRYF